MKRIAILSLLLVPSAAVGVEQASAQAPTRVASHFDSQPDVYGDQSVAHSQACEPSYCAPASCESAGGWFGDIGYYILEPRWNGNPAARVDVAAAGGPIQQDFEHDREFAPLISVGFAGPKGLGFRSRFWTLDSSDGVGVNNVAVAAGDSVMTPSLLGTGASFTAPAGGAIVTANARHELDLDVIDMEGLWASTIGRTSVLYSAGVRYAHLGQQYSGNLVVNGANLGTFGATNTFNGVGPTVSMQAYRGIGNTSLSLYGLGRGSVLFGENRERARSDAGNVVTTRSNTNDGLLPVVEMEVGINWTRNMGGFDFFAESGFVGQVWFDAGNAANSETLLGIDPAGFPAGLPSNLGTDDNSQDMGLVGLRYSTGIRF